MSYIDILKSQLEIDEGRVEYAYQDSLGYWTIGVGRLIDRRLGGRLRNDEIDLMLMNDIQEAEDIARSLLTNFDALSDERKAVVCNMAHNLGKTRLSEFRNTLAAISEGRFDDAADGMLASLWAKQVGARALRLSVKMRTG